MTETQNLNLVKNVKNASDIQIEVFEELTKNYVEELKLLKEMSIPFLNFDDFDQDSTFIFDIKSKRMQTIKKAENESLILRGVLFRINFINRTASQLECEFIVPQQMHTQLINLFAIENNFINKKIVCKYLGRMKSINHDAEYHAFVVKIFKNTEITEPFKPLLKKK